MRNLISCSGLLFSLFFLVLETEAAVKIQLPTHEQNLFQLKIEGEDAKALHEILRGTKISSEVFIKSLSCTSPNTCQMELESDMFSGNNCTQVNCGDNQTNTGVQVYPIVERLTAEEDRALLAPKSNFYFRHQDKFIKEYAKLFKLMEKSRSARLISEKVSEGKKIRLSTENIDIECLKKDGLHIEKQSDLFLPHGPVLTWHYFNNNYFCKLVVFSKISKNVKPTFKLVPNGLEVKLMALLNGTLAPISGVPFSLGGDFHDLFHAKAAIYQIPSQNTDANGAVQFTEFNYYMPDVIPRNPDKSVRIKTDGQLYMNPQFKSWSVEGCQHSLQSFLSIYKVENGNTLKPLTSYDYIFDYIESTSTFKDGAVVFNTKPGKVTYVIAGHNIKNPNTEEYQPQDLSVALAEYQKACSK